MHTACLPPCTVITLHRPWWRRVADALSAAARGAASRQAEGGPAGRWTTADLEALRGLSPQTLRDIGAPEWVHADRSAADRAGMDLLRL